MIFIGCFVYRIIIFFPTCGAYLEVVFGFEMKSNTLWSIESQTHYVTSWHVKLSLTLNELI
jgi:hypothetical protein